ncbi:hypothetical protein COCON_G00220370 [Conger conger]|uniref:Uncharacterized protein n=1 Tax=Conger conger TaxID=82655 RepID=A0A9Q1HPG9_CONCO|nr:hypothetical protein COCON_G00220370 [Conger conger]
MAFSTKWDLSGFRWIITLRISHNPLLLHSQLEKIYDPTNEEDDMLEMEEERLRMREHVMNEVDTDKDRLVSKEDLGWSGAKSWEESWGTLEQNQAYTEEEMREFEEHLAREEQDLKQKADDLQKQKEELERQQDQLNAQKMELQQAVEHMEQLKTQRVEPPPEIKVLETDGGHALPAPPENSQALPPDTCRTRPTHSQSEMPAPAEPHPCHNQQTNQKRIFNCALYPVTACRCHAGQWEGLETPAYLWEQGGGL